VADDYGRQEFAGRHKRLHKRIREFAGRLEEQRRFEATLATTGKPTGAEQQAYPAMKSRER
jgi:hypothetical protein